MSINFIDMFLLRKRAWMSYKQGELAKAKERARLIPNLLLPINSVLGVLALWLGIALRGL